MWLWYTSIRDNAQQRASTIHTQPAHCWCASMTKCRHNQTEVMESGLQIRYDRPDTHNKYTRTETEVHIEVRTSKMHPPNTTLMHSYNLVCTLSQQRKGQGLRWGLGFGPTALRASPLRWVAQSRRCKGQVLRARLGGPKWGSRAVSRLKWTGAFG